MWVGVVAAQFVAAGAVLSELAGWPMVTGIAVTAAVTIIYTAVGGQQSVLRTDVLQITMILCAIVLPLMFLPQLPAAAATATTVSATANIDINLLQWFALIIVVGGMYVVGPDMCSRALVARSDRAARHGAWLAAGGLLAVSLIVTLLGVAVRHSGLELTSGREALPALVNSTMPRYLAAAVSFGLLAALFSSADTCLMTAGSVLELDLIARLRTAGQSPARAKVMIVIIGVFSAVLAHVNPRIIGNIMLAYSVYAGGLLVPLLLLAAPRFARRIPKPVVWLATLVGGGAPLGLLLGNRINTTDFFLNLAAAGAIGAAICLAIILAGLILKRKA
jgi:SSS family solute:Na+ symporter